MLLWVCRTVNKEGKKRTVIITLHEATNDRYYGLNKAGRKGNNYVQYMYREMAWDRYSKVCVCVSLPLSLAYFVNLRMHWLFWLVVKDGKQASARELGEKERRDGGGWFFPFLLFLSYVVLPNASTHTHSERGFLQRDFYASVSAPPKQQIEEESISGFEAHTHTHTQTNTYVYVTLRHFATHSGIYYLCYLRRSREGGRKGGIGTERGRKCNRKCS